MTWRFEDKIIHLADNGIKLEPMDVEHVSGLMRAAATASEQEWEMGFVPTPDSISSYVKNAIDNRESGQSYPFTVCLDSGDPIGTSWYRVIDSRRKKLEIGFTWYATPHRKGIANLQTKLLLMTYAFEVLDCILVEFLVHQDNIVSQRAVSGLGAQQDGLLRRVIPMKDGSFANVMVFSVSNEEWPEVKGNIVRRLRERLNILLCSP